MIQRSAGLIICFLCNLVFADAAPVTNRNTAKQAPYVEAKQNVAMDNAIVFVHLKKISIPQKADCIHAEVDCDFTMTALRNAQSAYEMAFPYALDVGKDPCTRLNVVIDSKIMKVRPEKHLRLNGIPETSFYAYTWWAPGFKKTQHVRVSYSLEIPVQTDGAEFRYVLRSGGLWAAPIGKETVTIYAPGLQVIPAKEMRQAPKLAQDGRLIWELKNALPEEDIVVRITESDSHK